MTKCIYLIIKNSFQIPIIIFDKELGYTYLKNCLVFSQILKVLLILHKTFIHYLNNFIRIFIYKKKSLGFTKAFFPMLYL